MSKYNALGQHLTRLTGSHWRPEFHEIEAILGFALPASARSYPAWWSNNADHRQSAAWVDVGWKTEELDLGSERVTFRRAAAIIANQTRATAGIRTLPIDHKQQREPDVCEAAKSIELRIGMEWKPIGVILLSIDGRLDFPAPSELPGLYRFVVRTGFKERLYIGETINIKRRFAHYRNPGPTQQTNIRLNAQFKVALAEGAEIAVSTMTSGAWIERCGQHDKADLSSKVVRCLFENAALLDGGTVVEALNR